MYIHVWTLRDRYLARVEKLFPPEHAAVPYPSVFLGSGGRALMYLRRFDNFGNQSDLTTAQVCTYAEHVPPSICCVIFTHLNLHAWVWYSRKLQLFSRATGVLMLFLIEQSVILKYLPHMYFFTFAACQMYAEGALDQSGRIPTSLCGFLWGRTGIYAVTAVVRDRSNNQAGVQSLVDVLQEAFQASIDDDYCPYDDWDR